MNSIVPMMPSGPDTQMRSLSKVQDGVGMVAFLPENGTETVLLPEDGTRMVPLLPDDARMASLLW